MLVINDPSRTTHANRPRLYTCPFQSLHHAQKRTMGSFFHHPFSSQSIAANRIYSCTKFKTFRFLLLFSLMYPIERFNGITLDIIHRPKANFYKVLIMISVNIVADYIGITLLKGIDGIIIGVFFTILSGLIFGYSQLRKYLDYSILGILRTGYEETVLFVRKQLKLSTGS